MGQSGSRNKTQLMSLAHNSNCDTNSPNIAKPSKQTKQKQVAAIEIVSSFIENLIHKLQIVKYDEDFHPIATNTTQLSASSIDPRSIFVTNKQLSLHSIATPPPSPSLSKSSNQSNRISINQTYLILPQITGYGSDGQVRTCIHRLTSQKYAVKTIAKSSTRRKSARIHREVSFLKQVQHPNIVSLHDVYEDENTINIVTEMCHGGELFHKILEKKELNKMSRKSGRKVNPTPPCFREKDAARIIRSLLSAVSYLHSKDIVHRDIKPENILFAEKFDDESPIKLIDFGLSVRHPPQCRPLTSKVGTLGYMAPELIGGSYGRSCDLWSVGVVAYLVISGQQPFRGTSKDVTLKMTQRGLNANSMENSNSWNGVSEFAKEFIRCLLVVDPRKRLTADAALEHPWFEKVRQPKRKTCTDGTNQSRTRI
mmetsp:Transcript_40018/g.83725  ORF Transcript_40018/g.83725 Transcript_40018/m.83725 type:complete len:425 (-) Transcript_40018:412-1686(-)